jgi:hypothetical protein
MIEYKKKRDKLYALKKTRRLDDNEAFMLDRIENYLLALEYDMKYFIFQGGTRERTLDFCKKRNNKVFSIEELLSWKNDPDRPTTDDYDPILHLGGNKCFEGESFCYHMFGFISNEFAKELRPDIIESVPVKTNVELDKSLKKSTIQIIEKKRSELLSNADPLVAEYINNLLNQFANEVIGKNEKIVIEGKEISIEEAVEEISTKIITITDLITKQLKGLNNLKL